MIELTPQFRYEIERERAGNALFCPGTHAFAHSRPLPRLYEQAAQLLRLLLSAGFELRKDKSCHGTIVMIARVLDIAIHNAISHNDCAEYLVYHLYGYPEVLSKDRLRIKHQAMIGTFYGNLAAQLRK